MSSFVDVSTRKWIGDLDQFESVLEKELLDEIIARRSGIEGLTDLDARVR